jgi:hypothetical protein
MDNIIEGGACPASDVYDDFIKIFTGHMMPNREFSDSAEAVYPQL